MYQMLTEREAIEIEDRLPHMLCTPAQIALICNEMTGHDNAQMCSALANLFDDRSVINNHSGARESLRQVFESVGRRMETRVMLETRKQA